MKNKSLSKQWKHIYLINKSYMHKSLDPFFEYDENKILSLPIYLYNLENNSNVE